MKHTPVSEISRVADVHPVPLRPPMTRVERLERWAEALEREPDRVLTSIEEIEWKTNDERGAMRAESSALTVAFENPVLQRKDWPVIAWAMRQRSSGSRMQRPILPCVRVFTAKRCRPLWRRGACA